VDMNLVKEENKTGKVGNITEKTKGIENNH
jgi:hypothetical protein